MHFALTEQIDGQLLVPRRGLGDRSDVRERVERCDLIRERMRTDRELQEILRSGGYQRVGHERESPYDLFVHSMSRSREGGNR